ncbi:hypothetical protein C922_05339 [Plasmodium inui San Antonio 1]|uniref:Uncharacterized protein n=1 Tax=Plasmodium inui San Antonio 1 TaxID=1237626 RepID=W6ZY79_9APIC|nr:hypothetical protein C922_05339 [Plasmodium inui San Antonio 1]EUD64273.1 hypothetical protein C922_05339 [Plasmodium inui San Antonio 1]
MQKKITLTRKYTQRANINQKRSVEKPSRAQKSGTKEESKEKQTTEIGVQIAVAEPTTQKFRTKRKTTINPKGAKIKESEWHD